MSNLKVVLFWGSKIRGQGRRISKFILHTRTAIHRHSLGGVTSRRDRVPSSLTSVAVCHYALSPPALAFLLTAVYQVILLQGSNRTTTASKCSILNLLVAIYDQLVLGA